MRPGTMPRAGRKPRKRKPRLPWIAALEQLQAHRAAAAERRDQLERQLALRPATPTAPAATREPGPGYQLVEDPDDHTEQLLVPTPEEAVRVLLQVLPMIEPAEDPGDPSEWTDDQVRELSLPEGYVEVAGGGVHCEGREEDLDRLVRAWRERAAPNETPIDPRIRRSWWSRRRAGFDIFVPVAIRAVLAAGGNAAAVRRLQQDPWLYADTVADALAELRRAAQPAPVHAEAPRPLDLQHLSDRERKVLRILRIGPKTTAGLRGLGAITANDRRTLPSLWQQRLVEPCGSGKSRRGTWCCPSAVIERIPRDL